MCVIFLIIIIITDIQYTRETAVKQGLVGWVQNTHRCTVVGVAQGAGPQVDTL